MSDKAKEITYAFSKAQKKVMNAVQTGNIEQLRFLFVQYGRDIVNEFFLKEGFGILKWSIAYVKDSSVFDFFVSNLPIKMLRTFLRENDYEIIESFLMAEAGKEMFNQFVQRENRIAKFKLLLKIDEESIKWFMTKHSGDKYVTEKIKDDFKTAQTNITTRFVIQ